MCSAPSSWMISVPEAALLPSDAAADAPLEFVHDFRRKAVREKRERLVEMNAHHFPMAGGGVLSRRSQGAAAERRQGRGVGRKSGEGLDVAEAEAARLGSRRPTAARDIAQRVAAGVAVGGGVGHLADSYAIEDDPDDAPEHFSTVARDRVFAIHQTVHISNFGSVFCGVRTRACSVETRLDASFGALTTHASA